MVTPSEVRRQAAVRAWSSRGRARQALISQSLAYLDHQRSQPDASKRILFADSSDESGSEQLPCAGSVLSCPSCRGDEKYFMQKQQPFRQKDNY